MVLYSEALIEMVQAAEYEGLTWFWIAITRLGGLYVLPLLVGVIFYAVDKKTGYWIGLVVTLGVYLNGFLKGLISIPRPGMLEIGEMTSYAERLQIGSDLGILPGVEYETAGIPSGHSQGSMVFWGSVGFELKKLMWLFLAVIPLMVGFSRIYLGVHYLADVISGLAIGFGFVYLSYSYREMLYGYFSDFSLRGKVLSPLIVFSLLAALVFFFDRRLVILMGGMAGWIIGYVFETRYVGFEPKYHSHTGRILNLVVVGLLLLPIAAFLEFSGIPLEVFEYPETGLMAAGVFFAGLIFGILLTLVFPWVLVKLR